MYNDVLHVNYGISKICSICGTLVTRGSHFYQTPQTSETEVRIECRLVLIIANKELLCNITQHLRIDTRQHSIIIIAKSGQARGYECLKMTHLAYQSEHHGSGSSKSYNNRGTGD